MISGIKILLNKTVLCISSVALKYFQEKLNSGTITKEEYESLLLEEDQMNRKEILKNHKPAVTQLSNGRYYTRIEGRTIQRLSRKSVEDEVVEYYINNGKTLRSIFEKFYKVKCTERAEGTVKRYSDIFFKFIDESALSQIPLELIKKSDGSDFLSHCLSIYPDMKYKYWGNVIGVINQMIEYAIDMGYMTSDPFKNFHPNEDLFTSAQVHRDEETIFSREEKEKICELAINEALSKKDAVPFAIPILFQLGIRDGELCALKWSDIESDQKGETWIHIQRMLVVKYTNNKADGYKFVNHAKTKAGKRRLHLGPKAQNYFKEIRFLNTKNGYPIGPDDYIFLRTWEKKITYITPRSVYPRLGRYCKEAGMSEIKSPHDIRRTVITELHEKGLSLKKIQKFAGHSSLNMTLRYIRETDLSADDKQILDDL